MEAILNWKRFKAQGPLYLFLPGHTHYTHVAFDYHQLPPIDLSCR